MHLPAFGPLASVVGPLQKYVDDRRRVRVTVHRGFFEGGIGASALTTPVDVSSVPTTGTASAPDLPRFASGSSMTPYYFVKVTNNSKERDLSITHVWFESQTRVDLLSHVSSSVRRHGGQWEDWVSASAVAHIRNVERAARVMTTARKRPYKSRPYRNVPARGRVAWPPTSSQT